MRKRWYFFLIPAVLFAATTQIDWNSQIKNKPSLWNDPGSGSFLKRTGAYIWSVANSADLISLLGYTPENTANKNVANGYAPLDGTTKVPAANLPAAWNDPGTGTILKRTGAFTFGAAAAGTDFMGISTPVALNQTPLTTKGDLWCTDGSNNLRQAGASTTNWILAYDSSQTCALKWVYQPGLINSYAYNSTNQSITTSSYTVLTFDTNNYDNGGVHNTVTNNSRFTAPSAGTYFIHGEFTTSSIAGSYRILEITKNGGGTCGGTTIGVNTIAASSFGSTAPQLSVQVQTYAVLAANDYVEFCEKLDSPTMAVIAGIGSTYGSILRIQ